MTSIIQYPDIPCTYPTVAGANITTAIGNTPKVCAVFRNQSAVPNLHALMTRLDFAPVGASADTLLTIQLVNGTVTAVGGAWTPVGGHSTLDINTTATGLTGGFVGVTVYSTVTAGHGNTPPSGALTDVNAASLGLVLPIGGQFAIVCSTQTAGSTTSLAWTVNWIERD
jgi:hypothetical protein